MVHRCGSVLSFQLSDGADRYIVLVGNTAEKTLTVILVGGGRSLNEVVYVVVKPST